MRIPKTCIVDECRGRHKGLGYCDKHYQRLTSHGDVLKGEYKPTFQERLALGFVETEQFGCWLWIKGKSSNGYGSIKNGRKNANAHREMYKLFIGEIPKGLVLDHWLYPTRCIGRACVNPQHLRPTTLQDNTKRSALFVFNKCKRGHEFTEENTFRAKSGKRLCRACHRLRTQLWRENH